MGPFSKFDFWPIALITTINDSNKNDEIIFICKYKTRAFRIVGNFLNDCRQIVIIVLMAKYKVEVNLQHSNVKTNNFIS